jgi:hypothetical protein
MFSGFFLTKNFGWNPTVQQSAGFLHLAGMMLAKKLKLGS